MKSIAMAALVALLLAGLTGPRAALADDAHAYKKRAPITLRPANAARKGVLVADGKTAKGGKGAPAPAPPAAVAEPTAAKCTVIEFAATKTGTPSVDPKLAAYKNALSQPPLSGNFDTFKVTGSGDATMQSGKTGSVKISAKIDVLFKGPTTVKGKQRLEFEVTVDDASGTRLYRQTYKQDSGADLILSAGKQDKTNLFFAVTCVAQ